MNDSRDSEQPVYGRESQSLEFKESLSKGSKLEAIRSLVAFANTDGGSVVFGVADDGTVKGLQIGHKTREDFERFVRQHTYPPLPVQITGEQRRGGEVLRVETWPDRPPLTGCYMKSDTALQPDDPVDARKLQAFRRVGPTDQKVDFMNLGATGPDAPNIVITREGATTRGDVLPRSWTFRYSNVGTSWAFRPKFDINRPLTVSGPPLDVAPGAKPLEGNVVCEAVDLRELQRPIVLGVTYEDGEVRWRSTVELEPDSAMGYSTGRRTRRIIEFPSQRRFRGE